MADQLTGEIIGAAIEVHRELGPGLLESIYETALCRELDIRKLPFLRQIPVEVIYKGKVIRGQRIELVVQERVVVEVKSLQVLPYGSTSANTLLSESIKAQERTDHQLRRPAASGRRQTGLSVTSIFLRALCG